MVCQRVQSQDIIKPAAMDWLPKSEAIQAGAILVPENHDDPNGKKIQITYVVLKAKDKTSAAYPIIYFSGGPGGNTIGQGMVNFIMEQPVRNERDIILFDQRGIGYSSALPDMSYGSFDIMAKDANEEEELALMRQLVLDYKKNREELREAVRRISRIKTSVKETNVEGVDNLSFRGTERKKSFQKIYQKSVRF